MNWTKQFAETLHDWIEEAQDEWEEITAPEPKSSTVPWGALLALGAAAAGVYYLAQTRKDDIKAIAIQRLVEQPAENQSYSSLRDDLEESGNHMVQRAKAASDTESNRETLRHIIGIERWGLARVQSAVLHRPWVMDEHHDYKPPKDKTLSELIGIFEQQRKRTVALAQHLHEEPPRLNDKVPHNEFGPLTIRGWLRYLKMHADLESRRLR